MIEETFVLKLIYNSDNYPSFLFFGIRIFVFFFFFLKESYLEVKNQ